MGTWLNHVETVKNALEEMPCEEIKAFRKMLVERKGAVFVCGNGGSCANAAHFAEDLSKFWDRAVFALGQDQMMGTMVANDYGFNNSFVKPLNWLAKDHDCSQDTFVGISVSGKSANVIIAAEKASDLGMKVVALTGQEDSLLASNADLVIRVPSNENGFAEDLMMIVFHWICGGN